MKIEIHRPKEKDEEEILTLFTKTISDNFRHEGMIETHQVSLEKEIDFQMGTLKTDFQTAGQKNYFLVAKIEDKIVGTIAYGDPNQLIVENLSTFSDGIPELKSVYILPDFQSKGIGTLLFSKICSKMKENNIHEYYLDSGYKRAQEYWTKRLGQPICILKDFWGENADHMIWHHPIS